MGRSSAKVFKKRKGRYHGKKDDVSNTSSSNKTEEKKRDFEKCAREKKVPNINESYSNISSSGSSNILIDFEILSLVFFEMTRCKHCDNGLTLDHQKPNHGLVQKLILSCEMCGSKNTFFTSCKQEDSEKFKLNTRFVYALRSIGKGAEAGRMFCAIMDLPSPPTRFAPYNSMLLDASKAVCEQTMLEAATEASEESGSMDIAVALDGTWQKRGYSSLNGVVTATSVDTGKVLDVEILSKYCRCINKKQHSVECKRNFSGPSGMMEVNGAVSIFKRSKERYGLRYRKYLGDGDSKAFSTIQSLHIYGAENPVEKLECIGHVQKRMGSRLRKLKEKLKGKKLSDGKLLGGKNRLTDAKIDELQNYYGLAIRRNVHSLKEMRQAVWAIFLHRISTDQNPQHGFCPNDETWCGYKKAQAKGENFVHKNSLPVAVMEAMRPVFRDLSHPDLLKKCLHGLTQNPNESVNNVIWSRIPKTIFVQMDVLSLGVYDAVASFNSGQIVKAQVLEKLQITPGDQLISGLRNLDKERILRSKYAYSQQTKEKRKEKRLKRKRDDNALKNKNSAAYGAGLF